jgi:hypothetical protein
LKTLTVLVAVVLLLGLSVVVAHAGGLVDIPFDPVNNFPAPPVINDINNPYWTLYTQDLGERTFLYYTMPKVGDEGCEVNYVWVKNQTVLIAYPDQDLKAWEVQDWVYADDDCNGQPDIVDTGPPIIYDLSENTLDWYAQDDNGNVWYVGEWTEEYSCDDHNDPDCVSTEGSWKTADHAEDLAKVLRVNARVNLTFNETNPTEINPGEYGDCLKTKEWSPLEIGVVEHKYYCDGLFLLGNELQGGTVRTELVDIIDGPPPGEFTPPILSPSF